MTTAPTDATLRPDATPEPALASPGDPLLPWQWHLGNTGQTGGKPGIDVHVLPVWPDYAGAGIRVAVIDDGFDHQHPELAAAFDTAASYDFRAEDPDPTAAPGDHHGTAVADIIAAAANGTGVIGVAHARLGDTVHQYVERNVLIVFDAQLT